MPAKNEELGNDDRLNKIEKRLTRKTYPKKKRISNYEFLKDFRGRTRPVTGYKENQRKRKDRRLRADDLFERLGNLETGPVGDTAGAIESGSLGEEEPFKYTDQIEESLIGLKEKHDACVAECGKLHEEIKKIELMKTKESFKDIKLDYESTLIDLLIERILDPSPDWREKIDTLINIPTNFPGKYILKGGDYFEALFQLLFAINMSSRVKATKLKFFDIPDYKTLKPFKGQYGKMETDNYLYGKSVLNSGGGKAQGLSDITFEACSTSIGCKPSTQKTYICGNKSTVEEEEAVSQMYFFSIKGFRKEKSLKGDYDVPQIALQIRRIKNIEMGDDLSKKICVGVRNKTDFLTHIDRVKIGWLADLVRGNEFGYDEMMTDFQLYRKTFFSKYFPDEITAEDISGIEKSLIKKFILEKEFKIDFEPRQPMRLFFHQELVASAVMDRIKVKRGIGYTDKHYLCIGVLPRGGKSFIAGGILEQYRLYLNKPKFNVLFLTSAVSETMTQFKDDLIDKYSNFSDIEFIDIRKLKTKDQVLKDNNFIFVSRQFVSKSEDETDTSGLLKSDPKKKKTGLEEVNALISSLAIDIVFFDEAHIGVTSETANKVFDDAFSSFKCPIVLMTATYKKPANVLVTASDGDAKDDLFIWDLFDIKDMTNLASDGYDLFIHKKNYYDVLLRYGDKAIEILKNRQAHRITAQDTAQPYLNFPQFEFISPNFRPEIAEKIFESKDFKYADFFAIQPLTNTADSTNKDLIVDVKRWREWHTLLINREGRPQSLRDYLSFDPSSSAETAMMQIFKHTQLHGTLRPQIARKVKKPFSMLMFLPMITESVSALCRIWGSFLLQDDWYSKNFIVLTISKLNLNEGKKGHETKPTAGGGFEVVKMVGGTGDVDECVKAGFCLREELREEDLKTAIIEVEKEALRSGKCLLIISGDVAKMGISLPCVDIVAMLDDGRESDDVVQKMFRALTDSKYKKYGYVIDLNITRSIKALFEYDLEKDSQRRTLGSKSTEERFNSIMELCDFGQEAYIHDNVDKIDYDTMLQKIKEGVFGYLAEAHLSKSSEKIFKKEISMYDDIEAYRDIFDILKTTNLTGTDGGDKKYIEMKQGTSYKGRGKTKKNGKEKTTNRLAKPKEQLEEEVRRLAIQKAFNVRKTFINSLFMRSDLASNKIHVLVEKYKHDKQAFMNENEIDSLTALDLETIDCECKDIRVCSKEIKNNLFERVVCELINYADNKWDVLLNLINSLELLFSNNKIHTIWSEYIESLMKKIASGKRPVYSE